MLFTCYLSRNPVVHAKSLQSCPSLCDSMDCSPSGQAAILEWAARPSPRGPPWPGDWTPVSYLLSWQAGSLPLVPPGKPIILWGVYHIPSLEMRKLKFWEFESIALGKTHQKWLEPRCTGSQVRACHHARSSVFALVPELTVSIPWVPPGSRVARDASWHVLDLCLQRLQVNKIPKWFLGTLKDETP